MFRGNLPIVVKQSRSQSAFAGRWWFFGICLAFAVIFLANRSFAEPTSQLAEPTSEAPTTEGGRTDAPSAANVLQVDRSMPDIRVLRGESLPPPTIIDLDRIFAHAVPGETSRLTYELIGSEKEKSKVTKLADPKFFDGELHLNWKKTGKAEVTLRVGHPSGPSVDSNFKIEVWEPDYWNLLFTVVGGLGIFLLGMKSMSEVLQAVAGSSLRRMISFVTNNRFLAVGVGTGVTMAIQSSSITTVMVVGFVNSGMMTLSQAIGVIMGANIGTTITGWLLVAAGKYGLPLLGFGAFGYLFSRNDRFRFIAMALMGLGMVFFGLELMKDGFVMVRDLPEFKAWFAEFSAATYPGVLKCAAVGCILTLIVQSSSATLGITVSLAATGVIDFETGAALVLGENIGTTITAFLASLGTTVAARRAAYFHIMFNVIGVLWVTAIFLPVVVPVVKSMVGVEPGTTTIVDTTKGIALTHTLFNVTNTILFLPLVGVSARLLERFVPQRAVKEKPHLTNLDVRILESASISIEQSRVELVRMGTLVREQGERLAEASQSQVPDDRLVEKMFHHEDVLDRIQDEIIHFMTHLLSSSIPHKVAEDARHQLRMADEYESVGDYLLDILKSNLKLRDASLEMPPATHKELLELHEMVATQLALTIRAYEKRAPDLLEDSHQTVVSITRRIKEMRGRFAEHMSKERLDPQVVIAFNVQLNAYRRVREHTENLVDAILGKK